MLKCQRWSRQWPYSRSWPIDLQMFLSTTGHKASQQHFDYLVTSLLNSITLSEVRLSSMEQLLRHQRSGSTMPIMEMWRARLGMPASFGCWNIWCMGTRGSEVLFSFCIKACYHLFQLSLSLPFLYGRLNTALLGQLLLPYHTSQDWAWTRSWEQTSCVCVCVIVFCLCLCSSLYISWKKLKLFFIV